jgi:hypothetical protein
LNTWAATPDLASASTDALKSILELIDHPAALDAHPWTRSAFLREFLIQHPELRSVAPGRQLLFALATLFGATRPSMPPRKGLRLDTRWGEFGLLAARYFAPIVHGTAVPASLRDAWGRIDDAILLFVYGRADGPLPAADVRRYQLVGAEPEAAADSTLSDWHRKGLQRLAAVVRDRAARSNSAAMQGKRRARARSSRAIGPVLLGILLSVLGAGLALAAVKGYRIYQVAQPVQRDLAGLESMSSSADLRSLHGAASELRNLDGHLLALEDEAGPLLRLSPLACWMPLYGGDIAQVNSLLQLAHHLIASATGADAALSPLLDAASNEEELSVTQAVQMLSSAAPQLDQARAELTVAKEARGLIRADRLSPRIRQILESKIDPGMAAMDDGLMLASRLPALLGAGPNGPQTYLLLAQNEDELRATGGFITAVGKIVVAHGQVVDLSFQNSPDLDNWSMPYPMAPWQLSQYMNSSVLVLRDANWSPDFPTTALYVKQLYAYKYQNSVDGVVAFDQQMLVLLLSHLGPVTLEGASYPITAENVTAYMRGAKVRPTDQAVPADWTYKSFVGSLAKAVLNEILSRDASQWLDLSGVALDGLQQRHLVLQLDDRDAEAVLAEHGWNGVFSSDGGDFLAVVDSNVGFNKTNAAVDTSISYDVDLSDLASPQSALLVAHTNNASSKVVCIQWNEEAKDDYLYPIERCYWDYMRVYRPAGAGLASATPQTIPDSWMILNRQVAPMVDRLDEDLPGLSGFGTMLVVPGGGTINTSMSFDLPPSTILTKNLDGSLTYTLDVRKQPGTTAAPITVRVHLPSGSTMETASPDWVFDGRNLLIETNLRTDMHLQVKFRAR